MLYIRVPVDAESSEDEAIAALAESKATPWLSFEFRTPAPLFDHLEELEKELAALARLSRQAGPRAHIQVRWHGLEDVAEYGFLIKRSSAAVGGVQPSARLISAVIPVAGDYLERLFALELAAYLDGIAVDPGDVARLADLRLRLAELDPGVLVVVDGAAAPAEPMEVLAIAAGHAEAGADISLFEAWERQAEILQALKLLAREFSGDLSFDPYSRPDTEEGSWSFVRGDDLSIRVIARRAPEAEDLDLLFADSGLRDPALIDPDSGTAIPQWGYRRTQRGLEISLVASTPVVLVSLQRMTAEELEGIKGLEEELTVEEFYGLLAGADVLPETAAPSPGRFAEAFQRQLDAGADAVVCINLSAALSATMQSVKTAAEEFDTDIRVIDSRSITAGLGSIVLTAARMAADGADADAIVAEVESLRGRTRVFGALDTLENLKKGGRIGGAQALLGSMLAIKPILDLSTGEVQEAAKQRTRKKALAWLRDKLAEFDEVENLAVMHGEAPDVDEFLAMIEPVVDLEKVRVEKIGPVIGTHGGPGVMGIAFQLPA